MSESQKAPNLKNHKMKVKSFEEAQKERKMKKAPDMIKCMSERALVGQINSQKAKGDKADKEYVALLLAEAKSRGLELEKKEDQGQDNDDPKA